MPPLASLAPNGTHQFTSISYDTCGGVVTAILLWSAADPGAGSIDEAGLFTAGTVAKSYMATVIPALELISNPGGDGSYTVSWSDSDRATSYILQEAADADFSDAQVVYTGPDTSHAVSGQGPTRYFHLDSPHTVEVRLTGIPGGCNYDLYLFNEERGEHS